MKKLISKCLIILGLSIIIFTVYTNYNVKKDNEDIVKNYEKSIENPYDKEVEIDDNIVGILQIKDIDLKVAIGEGTDEETLKYAVGHFSDTKMPGEEGNFAVAGHSSYTYNRYFANLEDVKIGSAIDVITKRGNYTYKVKSAEVVTPDKVEVLNSSNDKKTITLITCTPRFIGSHRLVIKGEM